MKSTLATAIACFALFISACSDAPEGNAGAAESTETDYAVVDRIEAPDAGYDYVSVDSAANRLFVGREYGVMTVDLHTGVARTLLERNDVAAVLLLPDSDLMLSTNYGSNDATLFNRVTAEVIADIPTGLEPDGALFEPASGLIFVMNGGSQDVTVIDPESARSIATISVDGVPEAATTDGRGHVYINLEDTNEIVVIDVAERSVIGRYPLAECHEPTGIAFDSATGLLISACHNNIAKLIDAATGEDRGSFAIGAGADGVIFDQATRRGFVSCIDGTLTIFRLNEQGEIRVVQTVATADGARTQAYDPETDRLYLPAAHVERNEAGEYLRAVEGFQIIVVGRP